MKAAVYFRFVMSRLTEGFHAGLAGMRINGRIGKNPAAELRVLGFRFAHALPFFPGERGGGI
jgi:hypothetical protein